MADELSIFISFSREDASFVDRLEADLRTRDFKTWVDRRKLEGTREWQPDLDRAIAACSMIIVVLSPSALASPYVRHEYEFAHHLGKRIVPVLCQLGLPQLPRELSNFQWVDFVNCPYETSLIELIDCCQDPSFDQASDPRTLYNQAHDLESTDPERAMMLYQRLIDRDPTYAGGRARLDLEQLSQRLYSQRAQKLRGQAEAARKEGQYGAETGALKALIALGDQDKSMIAWATEYLSIAQQNAMWLDGYENVKHWLAVGDNERSRELLIHLWEHAPYFQDPAGIAPVLGVIVPMPYEEAKERQLTDDERANQLRLGQTTSLPSQFERGMAKPKIFVSHSKKDNAFTSRLVNDLNAAGAQAWMDNNDLGAGNFQERISQALADCEWFLLVLTPNALASTWVRLEVDAAIRRRNQKKVRELIFIQAADVDLEELPVFWSVFNIFDAFTGYETALATTLKTVGLPETVPNSFDYNLAEADALLVEKKYEAALKLFERTYQSALACNPGLFQDTPGAKGISIDMAAAKTTARAAEGMAMSLLNLRRAEEADKAHAEAQKWAEMNYSLQKLVILW